MPAKAPACLETVDNLMAVCGLCGLRALVRRTQITEEELACCMCLNQFSLFRINSSVPEDDEEGKRENRDWTERSLMIYGEGEIAGWPRVLSESFEEIVM